VVDDVYVGAEGEAFQACDDAERLGIEGVRSADSFLQYARENDFCVCRTVLGQFDPTEIADTGVTYRPTSNAGEAMGENSVTI
jgi:hypothetical protein